MRAMARAESLAAGCAQAWAAGRAQRSQWDIGEDILTQDLVEIDLVMFVDEGLVVLHDWQFDRQSGADIGAGQELFVELALDVGDGLLEASRAFEAHGGVILGVGEDTFCGTQQAGAAFDGAKKMELTGRIGEGLEELELPYGARAHEQELRHID